jgi:hypothetical protein
MMDEFFTKVMNDETGKLKEIARELFYLAQEAAKNEVDIADVASICTMGWQSATAPEMEHVFEFMLNSLKNR